LKTRVNAAGRDDSPNYAIAETIGRPLGSPAFLDRLELRLGRAVRPAKRERPKQAGSARSDDK
jgi:hypothetical protein